MNTNNMSDEELDDLFRKSTESYEPPYDEEAWTAMSKKLDGVQWWQVWRNGYYYILFIALLLSTLPLISLLEKPVSPAEEEETTVINEWDSVFDTDATAPRQVGLPEKDDLIPVAAESPAPIVKAAEPMERISLKETGIVSAQPEMHLRQQVSDLAATGAIAGAMDEGGQSPEEAQRARRSVRIALLLAPDITTVKFRDPQAVSANAGLIFSIPLTGRISLVSGAIWANKLYSASPEYYAHTADFWQGKTMPGSIDAACQVLDIPLNLQFTVLERGKHMLALQAGVSSYLMLQEDYTYNYRTYSSNYSTTRQVRNENQHWFGVQNVSVSYIRQLSPAISVSAEPYIKMPLTGIGEGRVRLTSAGVFFTAGYHLNYK